MGNNKRKFIFIFTILISFLFVKNVNADNLYTVDISEICAYEGSTKKYCYTNNGTFWYYSDTSDHMSWSNGPVLRVYNAAESYKGYNVLYYNFGLSEFPSKGDINENYSSMVTSVRFGGYTCVNTTNTVYTTEGYKNSANISGYCYFSPNTNTKVFYIELSPGLFPTVIRGTITLDYKEDISAGISETNDKLGETNSNIQKGNDLLEDSNKKQQEIINSQNKTNEKLDEVNESITSEDAPDIDGLSNDSIVGWLPAGPIDSILNLPLTMMTSLSNSIGSTCEPVDLPLPYVNKTLTLPCLSSIYSQIDGLSKLLNTVGIIVSAFILYSYFMKLYQWVDDTLTFRENNHIDNWGGL